MALYGLFFIVVKSLEWKSPGRIVNVLLYKMTIFQGLIQAQNCFKVKFYAGSLVI